MKHLFFRYIKVLLKIVFILTLSWVGHGCIKENLNECPLTNNFFLQVKVTDANTGTDITQTEEDLKCVTVFIFDQDEFFLEQVRITGEQVREGYRIPLEYDNINGLWFSVWGNLQEKQLVTEMSPGHHVDSSTIFLHTSEEGFALCPDDLFWGSRQIINAPQGVEGTHYEEVNISQKNARMHITVRGLPRTRNADDYYFTICGGNGGYNFRGEPIYPAIDIKQLGVFTESDELITPNAFNIIHTSQDQCLRINLHRLAPLTRNIIISTDRDVNDRQISPVAGETTNILIELIDGSVQTHIAITPWDEIHHWSNW